MFSYNIKYICIIRVLLQFPWKTSNFNFLLLKGISLVNSLRIGNTFYSFSIIGFLICLAFRLDPFTVGQKLKLPGRVLQVDDWKGVKHVSDSV